MIIYAVSPRAEYIQSGRSSSARRGSGSIPVRHKLFDCHTSSPRPVLTPVQVAPNPACLPKTSSYTNQFLIVPGAVNFSGRNSVRLGIK